MPYPNAKESRHRYPRMELAALFPCDTWILNTPVVSFPLADVVPPIVQLMSDALPSWLLQEYS